MEALEKRLSDFIEYFNAVLAKPFRWTYAGKPLRSEQPHHSRGVIENADVDAVVVVVVVVVGDGDGDVVDEATSR